MGADRGKRPRSPGTLIRWLSTLAVECDGIEQCWTLTETYGERKHQDNDESCSRNQLPMLLSELRKAVRHAR